jgi:membrane protein required for colicin V production
MSPEERGILEVLGWVDLGALIILAIFLILGLIRGFVWQIAQLVKLVGGFMMANRFAEQVGGWMTGERLQPPYSTYLAYLLVFGAFALAVTIVCVLIEKALKKLKLKSYDRLAGGGVGLLNGWMLVALLVLLLYAYPPFASTRVAIADSYAGAYAARSALLTRGFLPDDIRALVERIVRPGTVEQLDQETRDRELPFPVPPEQPPPEPR